MTPGQAENAQESLRLADQALRAAITLLESEALEDAASRLYFAVFHGATATLTVRGLSSRTHSGQIGLFTQEHGAAPILGRLFELRLRADYPKERFSAGRSEIEGMADDAGAFVERCRKIVSKAVAVGADEPDPPPDL